MTINLSVPQTMQELRPRITVVGVGGAGGNAVNNMINADLDGVDFLVANTDGQALAHSLASRKIQLGTAVTQGLGAGSKPDVGRAAAEESIEAVMSELADCNMVFITAGMGGGTGTGAAPVIARAARERGILTVGVVTKPFDFEGQRRMGQAEAGIEEMQSYVDTLIVIPNQNLFRLANERTTFADAFHMADTVLHQGVAGVTDLMIKPGQINLDFADIRAVMSEMGKAMMGTGEASGDGRATQAAEAAINNPLLDDISMHGARAVLINVTGGMDMTLFEVDEAANRIRREIDADSVIIFGSTFDEKLDGVMRVSIVATGIEAGSARRETPTFIQAPTTRRSTVISAPTAVTPAPAATAPAAEAPAAELPETPQAPQDALAAAGRGEPAPAETETPAEIEASDGSAAPGTDTSEVKTEPYVPAFVPTKASRLAFLATGRPAPRELPLPRRNDQVETDQENGQMSLEEAIASERATAFGSGMPVDPAGTKAPEATPEATGPADIADGVTAEDSGEPTEPVMVADNAAELTVRKPFVPATPAEMPEAESVPEATPAGGKTSLINKISGLWTNKSVEEEASARREPAVETAAEAEAAPAAPSILDLPRADAMSRMPDTASTAALDSQTDDLEIPAFLRRQAN
ncbi:MAG: cell division protein FtsZ [Candidatus Puniceispirillaceae bacterium]